MAGKIMKYTGILCMVLLGLSILGGCKKQVLEGSNTEEKYKIYYVNNEETRLVSENYKPVSVEMPDLIYELIGAMGKDAIDITYKKVLSDNIKITEANLTEGQLTLYFNKGYSSLNGITEILCRAAIVKTLCQIKEVNCVAFYVNEQPLMKAQGDKAVGFMTEEDFIDNTGGETNFYQNTTVNLFFTNQKGNALKEIQVNIVFDGTIPMEQLVMERLILGPESIENVDTNNVLPTVPLNSKLIKISTKDGICYVDFNEVFLEKLPDITDEVAIYSVVNSLTDLTSVDKVQFTINGKQQSTYRENTEFDIQFERNLDLVK